MQAFSRLFLIQLASLLAILGPGLAYSDGVKKKEGPFDVQEEMPELPEPSTLTLKTGGFFRAIEVEASTTHWVFSPISSKDSDENNDWSRVNTDERYTIDPLHFYGLRATFRTRLIDINLQYQSNKGFEAEAGDSSYLDLLLVLSGIPYFQRVSFYFQTLDFKTGRAELLDRTTNVPIDSATFRVLVDMIEARYQTKQFRFFARYMEYTLPRNFYLKHKRGEGEDAFYTYYPISDRLMAATHGIAMIGAAIDNRERTEIDKMLYEAPDRRNFIFGGLLGVGAGVYGMSDLGDNSPLYSDILFAVSGQLKLGYQLRFWDTLVVGLQNELELFVLFPQGIGVKDHFQDLAEDEGVDPEDLSLDFGVFEVLNRFTGFARLEF